MPAWSNLVVIISMDLHPIQLVECFNRQCNLNGFTSKFDWSNALTGNVISMDLDPIRLGRHINDLHPIQIRLVKFDWTLITGQIG